MKLNFRRLIFIILGITALVALTIFIYNKYYKPAPELSPAQEMLKKRQEVQAQFETIQKLRQLENYQSPTKEEIDSQFETIQKLREKEGYATSTNLTGENLLEKQQEVQSQFEAIQKLRAVQQ